jgi:TRAP-type C4-dicarboxylate transport system permease large subunit
VIILVPVLAPVAGQFGIDPLHFAMMLVLNLAIGMVTPPIGPVLFVICTVGKLRLERLVARRAAAAVRRTRRAGAGHRVPRISLTVPGWFGFTR